MSGYRRLRAQGIGAGAAEILSAVFEGPDGGARSEPVGSVHRVFDSSFYIEFRAEETPTLEIPGPRLIVIGGPRFSGPLSLQVEPERLGGFEPTQLSTGTRCTLRTTTPSAGSAKTHVLAAGRALEIEFAAELLEPEEKSPRATVELQTIHRESEIWRNAANAVSILIDSDVTDGLGWLDHVRQSMDSPGTPGAVADLVEAYVQALENGWATQPPEAGVELLGRGPGATPSGDDILAGVFLMLARTTSGVAHRRVRDAGDKLIELAEDRTTSISTALLAQAIRGRAADPILDAREALLRPQMDADQRRATLSDIREIGHTSGVDTLVGMLVALLYIGPKLSPSE